MSITACLNIDYFGPINTRIKLCPAVCEYAQTLNFTLAIFVSLGNAACDKMNTTTSVCFHSMKRMCNKICFNTSICQMI
jgi:hypothetical protein